MKKSQLKQIIKEEISKILKEDEGYDYSQMRSHFLEIVDELDEQINSKYPNVKGAIDQDFIYQTDSKTGDKEFEWIIDNGDQYVKVELFLYGIEQTNILSESKIHIHVTLIEKFKPSLFKRQGRDKVIDQFAEHISIGKGLFKEPINKITGKIMSEIDKRYNR